MARARKEFRELTVSEATNYGRKTAPMLRIQGLWLQELGFNIGDPVLLTMCDARTILCKTITEQVQETFQGQIKIFKSKIPNTVKVGESVYYSEPLIEYAPESNACRAYEKLAGEVIADES